MDKISVIIPVYKVANYIYKCALSLLCKLIRMWNIFL